jgi:hypothetical protein
MVRALVLVIPDTSPNARYSLYTDGARQRRSGGGCARRPVGTYLYLHAVGAGNPIAVPCLAR